MWAKEGHNDFKFKWISTTPVSAEAYDHSALVGLGYTEPAWFALTNEQAFDD